jgi:Transposase IS4
MSLNPFKQIRGAFHPEDKSAGNGCDDKCYQVRAAINELNAASLANVVTGGNCAFDEGGIACRSCYCPVRQEYNKDKPNKYQVDFFILACSTTYIIHHIDVYQGKNTANIGIDVPCVNLPTTMKAVANAAIKSELRRGSNDVNGFRVVSLDNQYQCPQLAFLMWSRLEDNKEHKHCLFADDVCGLSSLATHLFQVQYTSCGDMPCEQKRMATGYSLTNLHQQRSVE